MRSHAVLAAWVALVIAVTVPWASYRPHPHWDRVVWIPFRSAVIRPSDIADNVMLYVPLGWWWARRAPARLARPLGGAIVTAFVLSVACEWSQVYSHGRFPSATDVSMNVLGAALGVIVVGRVRRAPGTRAMVNR